MCLETGSYLLNYAACAQCGERDLEIKNHIVTEDEDELITYQRMYVTCYVKVCKSYQTKIVSLNFTLIYCLNIFMKKSDKASNANCNGMIICIIITAFCCLVHLVKLKIMMNHNLSQLKINN